MRAEAAACAYGSGEQEVEAGSAAAHPAIDKGVDGAQCPACRQRLLQRSFYNPKKKRKEL
jgi:hypothetical protein